MQEEWRTKHQVAKVVAQNLKNNLREQLNCGQNRSAKASMVELSLQLSGFKQMLHRPDRLAKALSDARQTNKVPFQLPCDVERAPGVVRQQLDGVSTVILNANSTNQQVILFLCGGAYFLPPTADHWRFLQRLAQQTGVQVIVPQYATAPAAQYSAAYDQLHRLYTMLYTQYPSSAITLMGDSAGAGLAAGFAEWLGEHGMPQPGHLVLISPWLDLTLTNPLIKKYQDHDVVLDVDGLRHVGRLWAGSTPLTDYRLSPIHGDVAKLKNVLVFAGTREIMFPDVMKFVQLLRNAHVRVEAQIGRQLYHEYPITPIPEARQALRKIQQFCFEKS
ncbi:alpha/beta hydrolase fold domain-containing protein [uncultured Limosilactobacillus sp.]|uniref:alpha/beta hydrolase fold domain-containing protein n=1 Tax=uncultured Limosilactobacillus sp. TaxID=2837629 RepID=UPI0025E58656|nr:alpha/beta hydrolase [uncultured Limosilactobacillus sp.]